MSWRPLESTPAGKRSSDSLYTTAKTREAPSARTSLPFRSSRIDSDSDRIIDNVEDRSFDNEKKSSLPSSPSSSSRMMSVASASGLPSRIQSSDAHTPSSSRLDDRHHPYRFYGRRRSKSSIPAINRATSGEDVRLPSLASLISSTTSSMSRDASSASSPSSASYESFSAASPSLFSSQSYHGGAPTHSPSHATSPRMQWRRGGGGSNLGNDGYGAQREDAPSSSSNPSRVQLPPLASLSIVPPPPPPTAAKPDSSPAHMQRPSMTNSTKSWSAVSPDLTPTGSTISHSFEGQRERLPVATSALSPRAMHSPPRSSSDQHLQSPLSSSRESDSLLRRTSDYGGEASSSTSSFGPLRTRNAVLSSMSSSMQQAPRPYGRKSAPTHLFRTSPPEPVQSMPTSSSSSSLYPRHSSLSMPHHPGYDRPSLGLLQDIFMQAFQLNDEYFNGRPGTRQAPDLHDLSSSSLSSMIRQEVDIIAQRDPHLADQMSLEAGLLRPTSSSTAPEYEPSAFWQPEAAARRNRARSSTSSSDVDHPFRHRMRALYDGTDDGPTTSDYPPSSSSSSSLAHRGQALVPSTHQAHARYDYHSHHHYHQQQPQQHQQQQHYQRPMSHHGPRPSSSSPRQAHHFTTSDPLPAHRAATTGTGTGTLARTPLKLAASSQPPKRVRKRKDEAEQSCLSCAATETPEWRKGPTGPRTLCNACGLLYAKQSRRREQDALARGDPSPSQLHQQQQQQQQQHRGARGDGGVGGSGGGGAGGSGNAQEEMSEEEKQMNLQELRMAVNARTFGLPTAAPLAAATSASANTTMMTNSSSSSSSSSATVGRSSRLTPPANDAPHPLYQRQPHSASPPMARITDRTAHAPLPAPTFGGPGGGYTSSRMRWHEPMQIEAPSSHHHHHYHPQAHRYHTHRPHSRSYPSPPPLRHFVESRESIASRTPMPRSSSSTPSPSLKQEEHDELAEDVAMA